jgi:hypothetical protein
VQRRGSPFLQRLFARFAPSVTIHCDAAAFTFCGSAGTQSLQTLLYLEPVGRFTRIAAIGIRLPSPSPALLKVDLLKPDSDPSNPHWLTPDLLLGAFVRHGIALVTSRWRGFQFRPTVTFYNTHCLDSAFAGDAELPLRRAAESAGASRVTFAEV